MATKKRTQDRPAFPRSASTSAHGVESAQRGLTVREFAAIQVLGSLLNGGEHDVLDPRSAAAIAVEYADALIASLQPEERH